MPDTHGVNAAHWMQRENTGLKQAITAHQTALTAERHLAEIQHERADTLERQLKERTQERDHARSLACRLTDELAERRGGGVDSPNIAAMYQQADVFCVVVNGPWGETTMPLPFPGGEAA